MRLNYSAGCSTMIPKYDCPRHKHSIIGSWLNGFLCQKRRQNEVMLELQKKGSTLGFRTWWLTSCDDYTFWMSKISSSDSFRPVFKSTLGIQDLLMASAVSWLKAVFVCCLIFLIALAGFNPLGQVRVQFKIVWHLNTFNGTSLNISMRSCKRIIR